MNVTIWTLNRCANLLAGQDDAVRGIFSKVGNVTFGERSGTDESPRQLMPEREYFVPIPLKCIGRFYEKSGSETDVALLNDITHSYTYFSEGEFGSWWTSAAEQKLPVLPDTLRPQMLTPDGVGYYELIDAHENNILIGYSQGGLVARYLGFLDRYVFRRNKVLAVFTVSSPNYGSPLGNPANQNSVTAGLLGVFASMLSFHDDRFHRLFQQFAVSANFDAFYDVIKSAKEDAQPDAGVHPPVESHEALPILDTAVKWLSGLHGNMDSAFAEIGIQNFSKKYSVLSLINSLDWPAAIYTGSVISANSDLNEILRSLILGGRPTWLRRIRQLAEELALEAVRRFRLFGIPIRDNETAAARIYSERVMKELIQNGLPVHIDALLRSYATDSPVPHPLDTGKATIPRLAHDYIIPSIYQTLPPNELLLGQYVNLGASHNSGKSPELKAGADNTAALLQLMRSLVSRLSP